jgi:hypothetical protein
MQAIDNKHCPDGHQRIAGRFDRKGMVMNHNNLYRL